MRPLLIVMAVGGASYLLLCLLVYVFQSRLVFFPDRVLVETPARAGLEYRDVVLTSEDGVRLHAWFVPAVERRHALLFCHGNAGNISHRIESIRIFHDLGLTVLIFDYRGYGRSDGKPSERGTYADARAAWRYLVDEEGFQPGDIILFGHSLGGAVAIELATHHEPGALIVESCFPSIIDVGRRVYPWLPVGLLARIRYDSRPRVAALGCAKLFIHSPQDELLAYDLGQRLFHDAAPPKRFLDMRGGHNDGFLVSGSQYVLGLEGFLQSVGVPRTKN